MSTDTIARVFEESVHHVQELHRRVIGSDPPSEVIGWVRDSHRQALENPKAREAIERNFDPPPGTAPTFGGRKYLSDFVAFGISMSAIRERDKALFFRLKPTMYDEIIRQAPDDPDMFMAVAVYQYSLERMFPGPNRKTLRSLERAITPLATLLFEEPPGKKVPVDPRLVAMRQRARQHGLTDLVEPCLAAGELERADGLLKEAEARALGERQWAAVKEEAASLGVVLADGESIDRARTRVRAAARLAEQREREEAVRAQQARAGDAERAWRWNEYERLTKKWDAAPPTKRPPQAELDLLFEQVGTAKSREFRKACYAFEQKFS